MDDPPGGAAEYCFVASATTLIVPSEILAETKVPDATPGIIGMYALNDEQALLAKLRYNRLIDVFTGVTSYSLQSHLRTTVPGVGRSRQTKSTSASIVVVCITSSRYKQKAAETR